MGDPRRLRKAYSTPKHPWRAEELSQELNLLGTYGLRNKKELWKAQTTLSRIKKRARQLLAAPPSVRGKMEAELTTYLNRMGLAPEGASLDDVLGLSIENVLNRRLQTVVLSRGLTKTIHQARQMIAHRHVAIGDRTVSVPSYFVRRDEEVAVALRPGVSLTGQVQA